MANGTLVKTFDIPANVRKQYARFTSLELYTDRLVGKGSKLGDVNFFFKNYMTKRESFSHTEWAVEGQILHELWPMPENCMKWELFLLLKV